jgi:hypothetical protein
LTPHRAKAGSFEYLTAELVGIPLARLTGVRIHSFGQGYYQAGEVFPERGKPWHDIAKNLYRCDGSWGDIEKLSMFVTSYHILSCRELKQQAANKYSINVGKTAAETFRSHSMGAALDASKRIPIAQLNKLPPITTLRS